MKTYRCLICGKHLGRLAELGSHLCRQHDIWTIDDTPHTPRGAACPVCGHQSNEMGFRFDIWARHLLKNDAFCLKLYGLADHDV